MRPNYQYHGVKRSRVTGKCPLCSERAELDLRHLEVKAQVNFLIPLGTYREIWASCGRCQARFPISPDLSQALLVSKKARRLHTAAWLTLPLPLVSLVLMILTLRNTPRTANETRMWSLIGLVPAGLITLTFLALLISL